MKVTVWNENLHEKTEERVTQPQHITHIIYMYITHTNTYHTNV